MISAVIHELALAGRTGASGARLADAAGAADIYGLVHRARLHLRRAAPAVAWLHSPAAGLYLLADPMPFIRLEA